MKEKILILGSEGQIGKPLKKFLENKNCEVCGLDIILDEQHDLRKSTTYLQNAFTKCDFVFFLAYDIGGSKYLADKQNAYAFIDNNVKIMETTFSLLKMTNKPFLFASSMMANMPWSSYGSLKRVGENYTNALNGINVRFWNVYGPEDIEERSHVITDFIKKAKTQNNITMLTDGSEERQFLFADDCAEILYSLYKSYAAASKYEKIDVSSGKWTSIMDIANIVAKHYTLEVIPSDKKDDVQHNSKIEPDLSLLNLFWNPANGTKIEDGIEQMIKYYEQE